MNYVALFIILNSLFMLPVAFGQEFTSTDYKILDPVIIPSGFSSSTDYQLTGVITQMGIGTSTGGSTYQLNSGFLFYPFIKVNLHGFATSGQAMLYWSNTSSNSGWTVSGYNVGQSTTSGGPYTYNSSVTGATTTATGLTNGTTYYFVLRAEDALGNSIATSSEVALFPGAAYGYQESYFETAADYTDVLTNTNGTQLSFGIPANAVSSATELKTRFYSRSEDDVIVSKPLPSGKAAANTFYELSFINPIASTSVASLDSAATLTFTYTDSDISGLDESTIAPYRWNGSSWAVIAGSSLDAANNKITFTSQNFSTFALLGTDSAVVDTPTPSSGSSNAGGGGYIAVSATPTFYYKDPIISVLNLLKNTLAAITAKQAPSEKDDLTAIAVKQPLNEVGVAKDLGWETDGRDKGAEDQKTPIPALPLVVVVVVVVVVLILRALLW